MTDRILNKLVSYDGIDFTEYDYSNSCLSYVNDVYCDERNIKWIQGDGIYAFDENASIITSINKRAQVSSEVKTILYPNPLIDRVDFTLSEKYTGVSNI
jgi:hypothetical protein